MSKQIRNVTLIAAAVFAGLIIVGVIASANGRSAGNAQFSRCVRQATEGQPFYWHGYNLTDSPIPVSYSAATLVICAPVNGG